jgi:HSP20 family molecular chaperone IbpA
VERTGLSAKEALMLATWNQLNRLLNDAVDSAGTATWHATTPTAWPRADVVETTDALEVIVDLPGLTSDDVSVVVEDSVLKLSGSRCVTYDEGVTAHKRERRSQSFSRSFRLGDVLEPSSAVARVEHGVLTVTIPKSAERQPLKIDVL